MSLETKKYMKISEEKMVVVVVVSQAISYENIIWQRTIDKVHSLKATAFLILTTMAEKKTTGKVIIPWAICIWIRNVDFSVVTDGEYINSTVQCTRTTSQTMNK